MFSEQVKEVTDHNREDDGSHSGLEDPEERQAKYLDESEQMDLPQWHMPQVDQVWLVFGWHEEQLESVHKLRTKEQYLKGQTISNSDY